MIRVKKRGLQGEIVYVDIVVCVHIRQLSRRLHKSGDADRVIYLVVLTDRANKLLVLNIFQPLYKF